LQRQLTELRRQQQHTEDYAMVTISALRACVMTCVHVDSDVCGRACVCMYVCMHACACVCACVRMCECDTSRTCVWQCPSSQRKSGIMTTSSHLPQNPRYVDHCRSRIGPSSTMHLSVSNCSSIDHVCMHDVAYVLASS
jgi:hypothetical protein